MTVHDDDAFPDADRLRDAMAEEVDRPGLEGPSFEAVMRSAAGRVRRRRVTTGATFAVAAVALATSVTVSRVGGGGAGGGSKGAAADGTPGVTTVGATSAGGGTTTGGTTDGSKPTGTTTTTTSGTTFGLGHVPADVVLKSGTFAGHPWRLTVHYDPDQPASSNDCADLSVYVDDVWTNAGGGGVDCILDGAVVHRTQPMDLPGFSAIEIIDAHHAHYGSVVAGSPNPAVTSVVAQCGSGKKYETTPFSAGGGYYYAFVFPSGSNCPNGTLSFYDASHKRVAFMDNVALGSAK